MSIVPEVSNTCHPAHTNATLQLIDEKIAHLHQRIIQLKSLRNGLAPISKLPPEVLGTIFYFALAGLRTQPKRIFSCYNFTHVSGSWRSVALNTPSLWQVLPQNIPWATAMLERSKGADLTIEWQFSRKHSSDHPMVLFLKEVLTRHAFCIRELSLDLSGMRTSPLPMLFESLHRSPLRLRTLKLTSDFNHGDCVFPSGVETGHLRTLAVTGCDGPWCSLSLPSDLTSLKLHDLSDRPPLVKFVEMLRQLPALEMLDMDDSLPSAQDFVGSIGPISLPRLSRLCLSSWTDYREVTNLLSIIIVAPTATLEFRAENRQSVAIPEINVIADEVVSSLSTFFGHFGQDTGFSYSNLDLFSDASGHLYLRAWKDDGTVSAMPDLDLTLSMQMTGSVQIMLGPIFRSLPFVNITTLTLNIVSWAMPTLLETVESTFGQLSRLQNVSVVGNCTTEFIQALTRKPEDYDTERGYYSVLFPALRSLWIRGFSFGRNGACTVEDLQDCLMERYEWRAELLKLEFTYCRGLRREDLERLRDIVSDVESYD